MGAMYVGLQLARRACTPIAQSHFGGCTKPSYKHTNGTARGRSGKVGTAATAPQSAAPRSGQDVEDGVEQNMILIGEVIQDVSEKMRLESATSYVFTHPLACTLPKLMKAAVERRLTRFNQLTLLTLNDLIVASQKEGNPLTELLLALKSEVLQQTKQVMPDALQELDDLCTDFDLDAVCSRIKAYNLDRLEELSRTAWQLVDDMESSGHVADAGLLCRVVHVWKRMQERLLVERPSAMESAPRASIDACVAACIKELMPLSDPLRRRASLYRVFADGMLPPTSNSKISQHEDDKVLPGMFFLGVDSIRRGMQAEPPKDLGTQLNLPGTVRRLQEIHDEAMSIILELAVRKAGQRP